MIVVVVLFVVVVGLRFARARTHTALHTAARTCTARTPHHHPLHLIPLNLYFRWFGQHGVDNLIIQHTRTQWTWDQIRRFLTICLCISDLPRTHSAHIRKCIDGGYFYFVRLASPRILPLQACYYILATYIYSIGKG